MLSFYRVLKQPLIFNSCNKSIRNCSSSNSSSSNSSSSSRSMSHSGDSSSLCSYVKHSSSCCNCSSNYICLCFFFSFSTAFSHFSYVRCNLYQALQ